jgi:hypothetical protein
MANASNIPVPSPAQIQQGLFPNGVHAAVPLNTVWSAQTLLTPFGGGLSNTSVKPSDQLAIGQFTYDNSTGVQLMRASLYLLESLTYYDFLFCTDGGTTQWWWLVSDPANPTALPSKAYGPYGSTAEVPTPTFLANEDFHHVGDWNVHGTTCMAFAAQSAPSAAGTWFWFNTQSETIARVMNVDSGNDFKLPIIGAYYLVDFPTVQNLNTSNLSQIRAMCPQGSNVPGPSPMLTLSDIERAMAESPSGSQIPCNVAQIQALLPGISHPSTQPAPPAWTDQVNSICYMIGQDAYPYYCQLWYDWDQGTQVTVFVTQDDHGNYTVRQDEILPKGAVGPAVNYEWANNAWQPSCCVKNGGVVPMPVPDFVQAASGQCRATIKANAYFGDLSIWTVQLGTASNWSDFWYWFNDQQQGVVFSLAPASSLTIIDYQTFVQSGDIPPGYLANPCGPIPACGAQQIQARAKTAFAPGKRKDK